MKKQLFLIVLLCTVSTILWAINPPSYVGRHIDDVLPEIDGTKTKSQSIIGDSISYRIFINDDIDITLDTDKGFIYTVRYSRTYSSSSNILENQDWQKAIMFLYLGGPHYPWPLGTPSSQKNEKLVWSNANVGDYFMNFRIKSYSIAIDFFPYIYKLTEVWANFDLL
jgi:hypothetical protein